MMLSKKRNNIQIKLLLLLTFFMTTKSHAHIYHHREGLAASWAVLALHACAQAEEGLRPVDLRQGIVRNVNGMVEVHHPAAPAISNFFTFPYMIEILTNSYPPYDGTQPSLPSPIGLITANPIERRIIIAFRHEQFTTSWSFLGVSNNPITPSSHLQSVGFNGYLHTDYVHLFERFVSSLNHGLLSIINSHGVNPSWEILVTGHGTGGAFATLTAPYIARVFSQQDHRNHLSVHLVTFAAPHIGYSDFSTWASRNLASAVSFEYEGDLAATVVRSAFNRLYSDPEASRVAVGEVVTLSDYQRPWILWPVEYSMRNYMAAIFQRLGWNYSHYFDVINPLMAGLLFNNLRLGIIHPHRMKRD
jgi:hypothetical protein